MHTYILYMHTYTLYLHTYTLYMHTYTLYMHAHMHARTCTHAHIIHKTNILVIEKAKVTYKIVYHSISQYGYCVSRVILYGVYHDTLVHCCIIPAPACTRCGPFSFSLFVHKAKPRLQKRHQHRFFPVF